MDNKLGITNEEKITKPAKTTRRKTILFYLLMILLVTTTASAAYLLRDRSAKSAEKQQADTITTLQQIKTDLEAQLVAEKAKNTSASDVANQTTCNPKSPSTTTVDNIKASVTSGNTVALEGYMASSVNVIIAASEGIGAQTPTQAVNDLTTFISSDNTSWDYDFSLPASILSSYGKSSYGSYFPSTAVVGKASNKQVISFSFDCNSKVKTVFLASSEDLLQ